MKPKMAHLPESDTDCKPFMMARADQDSVVWVRVDLLFLIFEVEDQQQWGRI